MSGRLVEMSGKVARGAELKVALCTPELGVILRVLYHHYVQSKVKRRESFVGMRGREGAVVVVVFVVVVVL